LLDTHLSAEQREFVETVQNSANALLSILNDILDFSKIEAGRLELEVVDFDPRLALQEVVELLAERAQSKGGGAAVRGGSRGAGALRGRPPARFRQVLTNLIGNAIKFTERGEVVASVTVAATQTEFARSSGWRSATPESGSRRTCRAACSRPSARPTRRRRGVSGERASGS